MSGRAWLLRVSVAVLLLLAVGCTSTTGNFLGFPEDRARKIEDQNPRIDYRLRGFTTMTKVQAADYEDYLRAKREGAIVKEERRGRFVYWAVQRGLNIALPPAGPDAAIGALLVVVERYKAPVPESRWPMFSQAWIAPSARR